MAICNIFVIFCGFVWESLYTFHLGIRWNESKFDSI